jgi:hypothetical protein
VVQQLTAPTDDLTGIDDLVAEVALARRARQRELAKGAFCGRRFTHPRWPTEFDVLGYLVVDICVPPTGWP